MRFAGLMAFLSVSIFLPGGVDAGGWPRGGTVRTPYGSAKMNSPEWRQSGGDIRVYDQLMRQKQVMLQQKALMKQQKAFLKQQRKNGIAQTSGSEPSRPAVTPKGKKKRPTRKADPASISSPKAKAPSKTATP